MLSAAPTSAITRSYRYLSRRPACQGASSITLRGVTVSAYTRTGTPVGGFGSGYASIVFDKGYALAVGNVIPGGPAEVVIAAPPDPQDIGSHAAIRFYDLGGNIVGGFGGLGVNVFPPGSALAVADLTGDGVAEVIVAVPGNPLNPLERGGITVYSGNGTVLSSFSGDFGPLFIPGDGLAAGDVTGDGTGDIVIAHASSGAPLDSGSISIHDLSGARVGGFTSSLGTLFQAGDVLAVGHSRLNIATDADGDSLLDAWESRGLDVDSDGTLDLDLPALGANPRRKDLFLEVDYFDCNVGGGDCAAGDTHVHRPLANAVQLVVNAFAAAPVTNPDGTTGITLHVQVDEALAHRNNCELDGSCFDGVKAQRLGTPAERASGNAGGIREARRRTFFYNLWVHDRAAGNGSSGRGELPGNDFVVSLGSWTGSVGTVNEQAGTLMHEFGHNLGLGHGGADSLNFKPNYLSVMSYQFQTTGLQPGNVFDYSRQTLPTLNELSLDETVGISATGPFLAFFTCPSGAPSSGPSSGPLDWNCSGAATETGVINDINNDRDCVQPGANGTLDTSPGGNDLVAGTLVTDGPDRTCETPVAAGSDDTQSRPVGDTQAPVLTGYDDWQNLRYNFRASPDYADGVHTTVGQVEELDKATADFIAQQQALAMAADLEVQGSVVPTEVKSGEALAYGFTVTNHGAGVASNVVVHVQVPDSVDVLGCTASQGTCGVSSPVRSLSLASLAPGATVSLTVSGRVTCTAADGTNASAMASVQSDTQDPEASNNAALVSASISNPPPVVTCGPGVTVGTEPGVCSASVTLTAPATQDNCPGVTVVAARSDGQPLSSAYGRGGTTVTWTATDAGGAQATCQQVVKVEDREAPRILGLAPSPAVLWPPNHRLVPVTAHYEVRDNCDGTSLPAQLTAASNEPINGLGDGDTAPDWAVQDGRHVQLRAERGGKGSGRVYTLEVTASDTSGNTGRATATVSVPKNSAR